MPSRPRTHRFAFPRASFALVLVAFATITAAVAGQGGRPSAEPAAATSPSASTVAASSAPSPTRSIAGPPGPSAGPPGPSLAPTASTPPSPSPSPSARTHDAALDAVLDATLERLRVKAGIPGISATIVFRDGSTWTGVAGLADVKAGRPVGADTEFAIASMSKTFTSAAVLELVAAGRLRLDEPVAPRLPGITIDRRITIRMLLDHTSGLDDFFLNPKIDRALQSDPRATWTAERALGYVRKPLFRPGAGWHYSNTNYVLLGLLVERTTGRTLAAELRDRFFAPLGLDGAYDQVAEKPRSAVAHGYRFAGASMKLPPIDLSDGSPMMPFRSVVTAARGAGSVAATSRDMARWAWSLYGGRVLDAATFGLLVSDVAAVAPLKPAVPYGLGVQAIPVGRFETLGHSGRLLGFRGVMRYLPSEDLSIAVLTNQSRADPAVVLNGLLGVVYPPVAPVPTPVGPPSAGPSSPPPSFPPPSS